MKVLVTGGYGFLGTHLTKTLEEHGHVVTRFRSSECDLLCFQATLDKFSSISPDVIIHCAANVGGIGKNQKAPAELMETNLRLGMNVVQASAATRIDKLVLIGTTCSYPKFCPVPFREEDLWNGYPEETNAPYGVAKKAVTVLAEAYGAQFGLNSITLILANLYGPGDNFDLNSGHVIPVLIRKFMEAIDRSEETVELWGDGSPTRDFLYVEDAAEAIALAAEVYDGPPVNIGTSGEFKIRAIAEHIQRLTGFTGEIVWDTSKPNGQPRRSLSCTRAHNAMSWHPKIGILQGLEKTVKWYRENRV